MKQRVISAAAGLAILAVVFALFDTIVLNIAVAIVIAMALYELIEAAGQKRLPTSVVAMVFGLAIPFFSTRLLNNNLASICFFFSLVLFCLLLKYHDIIRVEQLGFVFFFTMLVAFATTCFVYMRDVFGTVIGFYGMLVSLCGAWMSDTGAYFFGIAFGRRKLAPNISPKKTVEGFLGGILVALISQIIVAFVYTQISRYYGSAVQINYLRLALFSPLVSLISVVGDLSASVMKRQFGIKDFGNIMPGHGGVLDRFDSVLFVVPFVYNLFLYFPLIVVK
ncbi:MAG TPA: CDP-archaeol synthase [Clostridia bacterium]|nr:CDP-archaeol synthase [Clostridia bacterium]